jgi:hypothetical protein
MQVLIHSELLSTNTIVLFLVSNQNVPEEMSISHNNNKLNIVTITKYIIITLFNYSIDQLSKQYIKYGMNTRARNSQSELQP